VVEVVGVTAAVVTVTVTVIPSRMTAVGYEILKPVCKEHTAYAELYGSTWENVRKN
jgi:hypothetical protein